MLETVFNQPFLVTFLASTIRMVTPSRSARRDLYCKIGGVLNIPLETKMLTAALAGFIGAYYTQDNWLGLLMNSGKGGTRQDRHAFGEKCTASGHHGRAAPQDTQRRALCS